MDKFEIHVGWAADGDVMVQIPLGDSDQVHFVKISPAEAMAFSTDLILCSEEGQKIKDAGPRYWNLEFLVCVGSA